MTTSTGSSRTAIAAGLAALVIGSVFTTATHAAVIIPTKGGFSGHINLGAGAVAVKSNLLSSILSGKVNVGEKEIDSLNDSPNSSEGGAIPVINFEVSYTFASTRTQLHVGNLLEDFLRFDTSTVAGVRQDIGHAGLIGASVHTSSVDTQVWSDPYLTDAKRNDTDRTNKGFRVYWQQFMSSGLEMRYTASEIDIDKERSGESLALSSAQRALLDRNGDVDRFDLFYEFASDNKHHIVTPGLSYIDRDLDGNAMAHDGGVASINYIYKHNDHWRWVLNGSYSDLDWKSDNPIYAAQDSANGYGVSATMFYSEPFGLKEWAFNATAGWFEEDHDIDFYDSSASIFTLGMFRKF